MKNAFLLAVFIIGITCVHSIDTVLNSPCLDNANGQCEIRDQAAVGAYSETIFTMNAPGDSYVAVEAVVEQCENPPCEIPAIIIAPAVELELYHPNMSIANLQNTTTTYVWLNSSSLTMYAYFTGRLDKKNPYVLIFLNNQDAPLAFQYVMAFFPTLPGCVAGLVILTLIAMLASIIGPCVNAFFAERNMDDSENAVDTYRIEAPDAYILRKLAGKHIIPQLKQEIYGWKVYLAQKSHFLWIFFPEVDEVLPRTQRIIVTGTYVGVIYLLQIIWTKGSQNTLDSVPIQIFSTVIPPNAGPIFLQIFVGHLVGTASMFGLQFLARKTCAQQPLFTSYSNIVIRLAGRWFQSVVWMVFTVVWIIIFALMIELGSYCDCELFSFNLFAPFIGTLISQEAIPGAFLRFFMFCIKNAFGTSNSKQFEASSESKPLLIPQT